MNAQPGPEHGPTQADAPKPKTAFRAGVDRVAGPIRYGVDLTGAYAETGNEEPEKTKFAEEREKNRDKKERKTVTEEQLEEEKEAAKKEEKLTNKYDDGVKQVEDYFREVFGNQEHDYAIESTAQVQAALEAAGINLLPDEGEDPQQYAHRAARVVFHQVRVERFGPSTVAREGDMSRQGLGKVKVLGVEGWSLTKKVVQRFRINRQIASARTTAKSWLGEMGDRIDAFNDAEIVAKWKINADRGEVEASAAALAGVVNGAADRARDTHGYTEAGTLVNPLESILTRFNLVREPAAEGSQGADAAAPQPESDVVAAIRGQLNERQRNIGERMRATVVGAIDRMKLPADIMESVIGGDIKISSMLEGLLGVAGQTPEAAFRAHEALLDLKSLSDAMLKVSKGRLNIMLSLNRIVAEQTRGTVSVTDLIEATEPLADDYVVRHPEQGVAKLLNDARRQGWEMGGYTPAQRKVLRARYTAARYDFVTRKALRALETPKGAKDPYATDSEEKKKEEEGQEYQPRLSGWVLGLDKLNQSQRAKEWRVEQARKRTEERARKNRAHILPDSTPTAATANESFNRTRESISSQQTSEDLAETLRQRAEAMRTARDQAQMPVEEAPKPLSQEEEAALRRQEDQDLEAAGKRVADLQREAAAAALRANVTPRALEDLAMRLDDAAADLEDLRSDIDARRNPPTEEPNASEASADSSIGDNAEAAAASPVNDGGAESVRAGLEDRIRQQAASTGIEDLSDQDLSGLVAAALNMRNRMIDEEGVENPSADDVMDRLAMEASNRQRATDSTGGLPGANGAADASQENPDIRAALAGLSGRIRDELSNDAFIATQRQEFESRFGAAGADIFDQEVARLRAQQGGQAGV